MTLRDAASLPNGADAGLDNRAVLDRAGAGVAPDVAASSRSGANWISACGAVALHDRDGSGEE